MKKQKDTQNSLFEDDSRELNSVDNFIEELNEIGRQAYADFKIVENQLKIDVKNGLINQDDLDNITKDFLEALKQKPNPIVEVSEERVAFTFDNNRIQLFEFVPAILTNIPLIVKRILSKMLLKNIDINRIYIDKHSPDNVDGIEIKNVFYTTPYGSRITIELKDIYDVLLKIDFE